MADNPLTDPGSNLPGTKVAKGSETSAFKDAKAKAQTYLKNNQNETSDGSSLEDRGYGPNAKTTG